MNTENATAPRIHIGTSGYSFPDWKGPFYPPGTPSGEMLPYYAGIFNTVEVNYTYYRMPNAKTIDSMVRKTPDTFSFFVKANQGVTHKADLSETEAFIQALQPMTGTGRLAGILFQFPQSFKNTEPNRAYLARVAETFHFTIPAVEFRDRSWAYDPVYSFLHNAGLSIVAVDEPDVSTLFPRIPVVSGRIGYVRFHSRNAGKWYKGPVERYDYNYSEQELKEWVPLLGQITKRVRDVFMYFNNCHHGHAAENAQAMKKILQEAGISVS